MYPKELRDECVHLAISGKKKVIVIAREYGIAPATIDRWVNEYFRRRRVQAGMVDET